MMSQAKLFEKLPDKRNTDYEESLTCDLCRSRVTVIHDFEITTNPTFKKVKTKLCFSCVKNNPNQEGITKCFKCGWFSQKFLKNSEGKIRHFCNSCFDLLTRDNQTIKWKTKN